ncbi:Phosphate transport system permease protein PstA [Novipirellula galeiformis]|uniref:Phosphate transport system permease protein PstA n=1 Tax=Novipirellula galeiformis TaxID=2528004 RepID=A0A5C6CG79_9BACT|nr:PstA family ABC transporter permease [Novipirellula galeiformis]TWU23192.1 Phosphate transport system permease protein PstA [Novipirellula galeiformis]
MSQNSEVTNAKSPHRSLHGRHRLDRWFVRFCQATAMVSVIMLAIMLTAVFYQGLPGFSWRFVSSAPSATPSEAGIRPALFGSMWVCGVCALFALPIGVSTAIFLEEFKPRRRVMRWFHSFIQLNISNLAGVPSVVYGIIGLTAFAGMFGIMGQTNEAAFEVGATYFDQFVSEGDRILLVPADAAGAPEPILKSGLVALTSSGESVQVNVIGAKSRLPKQADVRAVTLREDAEAGRISKKTWYYFRLPLGRGVLTGGLTLMLVVLPIVIIASQESLRAVPNSLREGSLGMGATQWQTVQNVTLPSAIPGIMTGAILAMSRAIGEAAPVLIICGIVYIGSNPSNLMDDFSVMPLQIFNWAARPQAEFHSVAAQGIIVLLSLLLSFNAVAVLIRNRTQKTLS